MMSFVSDLSFFFVNQISFFFANFCTVSFDMLSLDKYQLNLPDPATPIMFGIHSLHNHILFFMCVIFATVAFLLFNILYYFSFYRDKYYDISFYLNKIISAFIRFCYNVITLPAVIIYHIFRMYDVGAHLFSGIDGDKEDEKRMNWFELDPRSRSQFWLIVAHTVFLILIGISFIYYFFYISMLQLYFYLVSLLSEENKKLIRTIPFFRYLDNLTGWDFKLLVYHPLHAVTVCDLLSWFFVKFYVVHINLVDLARLFGQIIDDNEVPSKLSDDLVHNKIKWLTYLTKHRQYRVTHNLQLEVIWTIIPTLILIIIAIPSFALLYSMDELLDPTVTVKIIGHQWYWSYEYSDFRPLLNESVKFDSYMVPDSELSFGDLRLLKTDCPLILPKETNIRFLITSTDVLHSWAVPSFGIKMDAVPGRLNQTSAYIMEAGRFYGQCSELCGVNHGFMPIEICVVEPVDYYNWIYLKLGNV